MWNSSPFFNDSDISLSLCDNFFTDMDWKSRPPLIPMKTMDQSTWSPYSQQPFTHGNSGSPRSLILPPSTPTEDTVNSYGSANLLLSPCQGLQPLPARPNTADPSVHPPSMLNSHYEPALLSPPIRSSKDPGDYFSNSLYNGVCKESQSLMEDFLRAPILPSRNDNLGCLGSENSDSGFGSQVPSISYQPKTIDRPSPGPFGVLPHEAVMTQQNRYDRSKDKFLLPISKPTSVQFNGGPFCDPDINSVYTSTPLTTHSVFSTENSSRSPVVNSVTSPNVSNISSSPSDYYSSPKNNFGAYNSLQSPLPQSPSVAQHSYPSSPFTNLDAVNHMPAVAPPCSPMSGGSYVSKLQEHTGIVSQVPQRNGQKSQHSSGSMGGSNVMCYNTQPPQGMLHHVHQASIPKTPDYHSDYNVFSHNQISPASYSSVYPAMHPAHMACDDVTMTQRPHMSHPNMPHDNQLQYSHPTSVPPSSMTSPTYLQSKTSNAHDMLFGSCSGNLPTGQTMHSTRYDNISSVIDPLRNNSLHHHQTTDSMMPMMMGNSRQFTYHSSDMVDDKNALDMFNSHIDSGVHNPDNCQSSISSFLDTELPTLDSAMLNSRELGLPEPNNPPPVSAMSIENIDHGLTTNAQASIFHDCRNVMTDEVLAPMKTNVSYSYDSNREPYRPGNMSFNPVPRRRGRRGRRRKADINSSDTYCRYQTYKNDQNTAVFNNGFQIDQNKFPEYGNNNNNTTTITTTTNNNSSSSNNNNNYYGNDEYRRYDCFNSYPKTYKERLDAYEFHTPSYTPSKYQSLRKKDDRSKPQNCVTTQNHRPRVFYSVEEELHFLGELKFPHQEVEDSRHTFMKTRNKDSEGFLQCYKNFLEIRKTVPDEDADSFPPPKEHKHSKEHKEKKEPKHQPKLIIKMGRCNNPGEWRLTETHVSPARSDSSDESASQDSNISSHKVSDNDSNLLDTKSRKTDRDTGNLLPISEKLSKNCAKRIFKYAGRFSKHKERTREVCTNSQTFPAGGKDISSEKPMPKKRGRKAKNSSLGAAKKKTQHSSLKTISEDPLKNLPYPIKQEVLSDEEVKPAPFSARRLSLRSKREEPVFKVQPQAGPSIKIEPLDVSSDEIDLRDDSDSDPAWTPTSRAPKPIESGKSHVSGPVPKKQRRRKSSASSARQTKPKRENHDGALSSKQTEKVSKNTGKRRKKSDPDATTKSEKNKETFFILKSDLGNDKASIWKLDNTNQSVQRFDVCEFQGKLVHRNTYTFSSFNNVTERNYLLAKVQVLSYDHPLYVVKYLGLEQTSNQDDIFRFSNPSPLRDSFHIYLESLIGQALDPNSQHEINYVKSDLLHESIKRIENMNEQKKKCLLKDTCDKELQKCAEIYPCVNILPCASSGDSKCQICSASKREKLVQFYGPPYDSTTLGSKSESRLSNKTQFNVCTICSTTVSLYNRLHHQKYNIFIKCRTKMNILKADRHMESNKLLDHCLKDYTWVNMLFHELEAAWEECDRMS